MRQVLWFSVLLVAGMAGSLLLPAPGAAPVSREVVRLLTMFCLAFIMIHVGYEFEVERANLRGLALDYGIAATAAAFPWVLCAVYFVFVMASPPAWGSFETWRSSLIAARFAAPTSAGVLFSMLAAAGLSGSWLFRKARVLAIFDDLDTVLLMIPLKMMIVGLRWQLAVIVAVMGGLLWLGWRRLRALRAPVAWPWVLGYAAALVLVTEGIAHASVLVDEVLPIHIEILLPAFVLGCMLARPAGHDPHADDGREGHQEGPEPPAEQRVSMLVSGSFMVLVGLSMPPLSAAAGAGTWRMLALHTLAITLLANLGKMFPLACYRREAHWRERLALCIGMWPRGEVGAGVLVLSIGYGLGGPMLTVATLSLALNLLLTGVFIVAAKALLRGVPGRGGEPAAA